MGRRCPGENSSAPPAPHQTLPQVKQKHGSIHGALQHERRGHSAQAQAGHKGDGLPMPVRRVLQGREEFGSHWTGGVREGSARHLEAPKGLRQRRCTATLADQRWRLRDGHG
jgi:hypothetical protein